VQNSFKIQIKFELESNQENRKGFSNLKILSGQICKRPVQPTPLRPAPAYSIFLFILPFSPPARPSCISNNDINAQLHAMSASCPHHMRPPQTRSSLVAPRKKMGASSISSKPESKQNSTDSQSNQQGSLILFVITITTSLRPC
jgi:hypothetical protein